MHRTTTIGDLPVVALSAKDKANLVSAANLLEELRSMRESAAEDPERDDDTTLDIALAAHVCRELGAQTIHDL